jgi:hypothetical protein
VGTAWRCEGGWRGVEGRGVEWGGWMGGWRGGEGGGGREVKWTWELEYEKLFLFLGLYMVSKSIF